MTTRLTVLATGGTIAGIAGSAIAKDYRAGEIGIDAYLEDVGALGLEADLNVILQSTADRAEGIQSFLQRRQPKFTGR